MAREQLENLSSEKLLRRKKLAAWVLGLLLLVICLSVSVTIYVYIRDRELTYSTLPGVFGCTLVAIILAVGIRKINNELSGRDLPDQ